jgi:hypothetical protein
VIQQDQQIARAGLDMDWKRTKNNRRRPSGGCAAGRRRDAVKLELDLLLSYHQVELYAILVKIWQTSDFQEVVARALGPASVGFQLVRERFEKRLADDSVLSHITGRNNLCGYSSSLVGQCQQMSQQER